MSRDNLSLRCKIAQSHPIVCKPIWLLVSCGILSAAAHAEDAGIPLVPAALTKLAPTKLSLTSPPTGTSASASKPGGPRLAVLGSPPRSSTTSPSGFRRGLRDRDFSVGYGEKLPFGRFNGRTKVSQVQFLHRWGRFRNSRQELLWEMPVTLFTDPGVGLASGVNIVFRQHFGGNRKFTPFVEFGPGILLTNYDIRDITGSFQFSLQSGVGLRAKLGKRSNIVLSTRWYHVSNLGTRAPNVGLNQSLFSVGYSQLY